MSWKASMCSSSFTFFAGISPATILQKMHSIDPSTAGRGALEATR
jgi:hypothetical protein